MKAIFNETMSSTEAVRIFFDYAAAHRGEDLNEVEKEFRKVSAQISQRERQDGKNRMTSYRLD